MLNKEKYAAELVEILVNCGNLGVVNNKPVNCLEINCNECDFPGKGCIRRRNKWANSEYVEKPKLTKKERQFCELVETGWIARDRDTNLWWYKNKPTKRDMVWGCTTGDAIRQSALRDIGIHFDFVKWEDEEPWAVEDLLKLEVEE